MIETSTEELTLINQTYIKILVTVMQSAANVPPNEQYKY
jgi:hypothetical protein